MRDIKHTSIKFPDNVFSNMFANFSLSILSEKEVYNDYKNGKSNIIAIGEGKKELEILEFLDNLGFPINEVGTYYYKDLIIRILALLDEGISVEEISQALEEPYSQLYFDVARNELDVGIKSYNGIINLAFEGIDISKANPDLLKIIVEKMNDAISNYQLPLIIAQEYRMPTKGRIRKS